MATVGISQQTLRYWRKTLPPLAHRDGYTLNIYPRSGKVTRSMRGEDRVAEELEIVVPLGKCIQELIDALQGNPRGPSSFRVERDSENRWSS